MHAFSVFLLSLGLNSANDEPHFFDSAMTINLSTKLLKIHKYDFYTFTVFNTLQ